MSSGGTHVKASLMLAAGFSVGALISQDINLLKCVAGSLVGILVTPDADVDKSTVANQIIKKKVGWFGERLWRWFWSGYSSSFKHGQFASHFPVFGTFVRLSYIYFWVIFIPHFLIYFSLNPHWNLIFVLEWYARIFIEFYFMCGLIGSDLIHYTLDKLTKNME